MFKEIIGNIYPYINQKEALFTLIYSIIFWISIGFTAITIIFLLPIFILAGVLYFYYYKLTYKDFPQGLQLEKLENKIIHKHSPNLIFHHFNKIYSVKSCNKRYESFIHFLYVPSIQKTKETLVLLHGTSSSATCLSNVYKYLNNIFNIIAIDLPGFGRSKVKNFDNIRKEVGVMYYIDLLKEFFKTEKLNNVILAGHSWGGYIASSYSVHHKIYVKQLMLIEPPGLLPTMGNYGAYWAFVFKYKVMHLPKHLGKVGLMCAQSFFHLFNYELNALYSYILNNNENNWGPDILADHITYGWTGGYWNSAIIQKLINVSVPFTVFYGEKDLIIPKDQKILLDKLYPESCVVLKECGHSPHTEHPKELSYKMLYSYRNMKNYRKHIKMNVKTIQDYFIDIHHLENFKSTFNPSYTKKITDILYKKYYLL
tara:strand:+ start:1980 stop:3257 length:1278 start_codon:yes stop_codon:yes gene_type:complete